MWILPPFSQKFFGRSFDKADPSDWKEKLEAVHEWLWKKWSLVKKQKQFKLKKGIAEQTPGKVPVDILQKLEGIVQQLDSKIRYPRQEGAVG